MLLKNGLIPLITLLITLFIGCADDITQPGNAVTVNLTDIFGFEYPTRFSSPNISIGDYPIMMTDQSGTCNFYNIPKPYRVTVEGEGAFFSFNNISISNPKVVVGRFTNPFGSSNYQLCYFHISVQIPEYYHVILLRFISKDKFFENPNDIIVPERGEGQLTRYIEIPQGISSISGKLVLLYCAGFSYENFNGENATIVYSFDSIGVKDITLFPGNNDSVIFSHNDIIRNPSESQIVYTTETNNSQFTEAYFTFPGYSVSSDILFYRMSFSNWSCPVPTNLPIPFEVKVRSVIRYPSFMMLPQVILRGGVGSEFHLRHVPVELIYPKNGQRGINDTTVFRFNNDTENGIYAVEINKTYLTFTDKNEMTFAEMKNRGFYGLGNTDYAWRVYKISTFKDLNDFLSTPFNLNIQFNRVSISDTSAFRTAE